MDQGRGREVGEREEERAHGIREAPPREAVGDERRPREDDRLRDRREARPGEDRPEDGVEGREQSDARVQVVPEGGVSRVAFQEGSPDRVLEADRMVPGVVVPESEPVEEPERVNGEPESNEEGRDRDRNDERSPEACRARSRERQAPDDRGAQEDRSQDRLREEWPSLDEPLAGEREQEREERKERARGGLERGLSGSLSQEQGRVDESREEPERDEELPRRVGAHVARALGERDVVRHELGQASRRASELEREHRRRHDRALAVLRHRAPL